MRSAVIVPVREAAPVVDRWRELTCNAKPSLGVPPHITLLFPFAPITQDVISDLHDLFAPVKPFTIVLGKLERFPGDLTIAQGEDDVLERAEADVARSLPITAGVVEAQLLEEGAPWRIVARFRF